eukprot:CAMPEP_0172471362 /NCGR_PEP_ID=MMETSP1065-20121228/67778_1 /TAXON_ID=265537 /ORGANISM="Amphiprora paludosa, Strain CCMP125" /LENGTH=243 /DNA_ID=CAMNT_0013229457 /DNA_START=171 /DNA_END=902 /DNA_ORIENTATION=+
MSSPATTADPPKKKLKLTYFNIEGVAEPIRLALILAGVAFDDERLSYKDWTAFKDKTPYGQMPVLEFLEGKANGDVKAQSGAMLRFVGREYSSTLYPTSSLYDIEEALGVVGDLKTSWGPNLYMGMRPEIYGYPKDYASTEEGKAKVQEMRQAWVANEMPRFMGYLERLLQRHEGQWIASATHVTIADCEAVVFLRSLTRGHVDHVPKDCWTKNHPELVAYVKRFCALPEIKGRYKDGLREDS